MLSLKPWWSERYRIAIVRVSRVLVERYERSWDALEGCMLQQLPCQRRFSSPWLTGNEHQRLARQSSLQKSVQRSDAGWPTFDAVLRHSADPRLDKKLDAVLAVTCRQVSQEHEKSGRQLNNRTGGL